MTSKEIMPLENQLTAKVFKEGLVIGKFIPLHFGHMSLIDFALSQCEHLTVALVVKPTDPIELSVRLGWFSWLKDTGRNLSVAVVDEALPQTNGIEEEAAKVWTDYFVRRFTEIDCLFSSEHYGDLLASAMKKPHRYFDVERNQIQISGTTIRKNPSCHLEYLPEPVRAYYEKLK